MLKTVFSVGPAPRLYNEDPRPAEKMTERVECRVRLSTAMEAEKGWRSSSDEGIAG
jgi:hypothetical protein